MDKRYQVFVSSTFADLKDERSSVIQTLMEMDCIPAGMELFPAADEDQLDFIKRVIDDCDYYIVIVGARYGSLGPDGVSYTEKEYEYALERGLKVIALLHDDPESLPMAKSEPDPEVRERLESFRTRLTDGRLVRFWNKPDELPGLVALSLNKTIKMFPAVGWVRATQRPSADLVQEVADLRSKNEELKSKLQQATAEKAPTVPNLAGIDDKLQVTGTCRVGSRQHRRDEAWSLKVSWRDLFALLAPYLMDALNEASVASRLSQDLFEKQKTRGEYAKIDDQVFQTIKIQLLAHGLVHTRYSPTIKGGAATFWQLTPAGKALMFEARTVKGDAAG